MVSPERTLQGQKHSSIKDHGFREEAVHVIGRVVLGLRAHAWYHGNALECHVFVHRDTKDANAAEWSNISGSKVRSSQ